MPETSNYQKHISKNPIQKLLISNFYKTVIKTLKPLKLVSVLDVGCGEGFTLINLGRNRIGRVYEGVDYSNDAIKLAKKLYPKLFVKQGDIYSLPYKDSSFDILLCTEVLEHLKNPSKAIGELKRVSKKYILFSVPNEPFFVLGNFLRGKYLKTFGNHPEHINHWSVFSFKKFLRSHGLRTCTVKLPFPWTLVLARK